MALYICKLPVPENILKKYNYVNAIYDSEHDPEYNYTIYSGGGESGEMYEHKSCIIHNLSDEDIIYLTLSGSYVGKAMLVDIMEPIYSEVISILEN